MNHITLLMRCHDMLRGVEIHTPSGVLKPAADSLAKDINNYLNHISSHTHDCWSWGPEHYMCAYEKVKQLEEKLHALQASAKSQG